MPSSKIFRSPLQPMWDLTIHPLRSLASSLHIVPCLALIPFKSTATLARYDRRHPHGYKTCLLERGFHAKECFVLLPTNMGSHNVL